MSVTIRPGRPGDVGACVDVFLAAIGDLMRRQGRVPPTLDPGFEGAILAHGVRLAPDGFHVAEGDGRVVAFASAFPRDGLWFLGFLFALPDAQRGGVGGRLLDLALAPGAARSAPNAFLFASTDLPAMGLYVRRGLLPWTTCLTYEVPVSFAGAGAEPADALDSAASEPAAPEGALRVGPLTSGSLAFERERFGFARGGDHRLLAEHGSKGFALATAEGARAGFFYVTKDARLGPMAVAESRDWPAALAHALAVAREQGHARLLLRIPNEATEALRWASAHGGLLRNVNLVMSHSPLARLDRVLLGPPGLM